MERNDKMEVQNAFKDWCFNNGYTAQTIADKIGCSKSTIHAYFQGKRSPSRETLKKMDNAGINVNEVVRMF